MRAEILPQFNSARLPRNFQGSGSFTSLRILKTQRYRLKRPTRKLPTRQIKNPVEHHKDERRGRNREEASFPSEGDNLNKAIAYPLPWACPESLTHACLH